MFDSIDPSTGQLLASFDELSDPKLDAKLDASVQAQRSWRHVPVIERAQLLKATAEVLDAQQERWARLMTQEMGKTLKSALSEVAKCAWACRYYAEHGPDFLRDEAIATEAAASYVRYLPLGPLLAVMPWNFPFWQLFRFLAPALVAGNSVLLKHSSNVPQCALAIEEVLRLAGAPAGLFQTLLIGSKRVAGVIADSRIAAVSMTGSEAAGRQVAQAAGAHIKKCVLELGSNDAFIVMPSADLERAVQAAVQARVMNNGQSCVAAKRFVIHRDIYPQFEARFVQLMAALKVGDPQDQATDVGPLATLQTLLDLESQVNDSRDQGALLLCGGQRLGERGYFYAPAALSQIPSMAPMYHEEVFGPAAALFQVSSLDQAVALVNDSPYGLGASCWTTEEDEQQQFINELQTGLTFVNSPVASDPRLPFGGVKRSGYGRELGRFGLLEFVNAKTVSVAR
jgi:succinate-semialdehyde dehydrogenase/glutarate-semialdehyde dehydrogenase